jgi:WD40 repeat protein
MGVSFVGDYGNLSGISIPNADLSDGIFSCADFTGANLEGVSFKGAWLDYANFSGANLMGVSFGQIELFLEGKSPVKSICYSPDGCYLATTEGRDIGIFEKDRSGYRRVTTLTGHSNWVTSVAYSPDGRCLASGSDDRTIGLWEVNTGKRRATLTGHSYSVSSVTYSPDGRCLASGSHDTTLGLWEVNTGKRLTTLTGHNVIPFKETYSKRSSFLCGFRSKRTGLIRNEVVAMKTEGDKSLKYPLIFI